jgi:hypothetical protein
MKKQRNPLFPFVIVFLFFNGLSLAGKSIIARWGIDYNILILANSLFLILSLLVFRLQRKAMQNKNPNVFVRTVMGGMMIKMFIFIFVIIIYWFTMRDSFSKVSVIAAMFLYLIYLATEVKLLTNLMKKKNG